MPAAPSTALAVRATNPTTDHTPGPQPRHHSARPAPASPTAATDPVQLPLASNWWDLLSDLTTFDALDIHAAHEWARLHCVAGLTGVSGKREAPCVHGPRVELAARPQRWACVGIQQGSTPARWQRLVVKDRNSMTLWSAELTATSRWRGSASSATPPWPDRADLRAAPRPWSHPLPSFTRAAMASPPHRAFFANQIHAFLETMTDQRLPLRLRLTNAGVSLRYDSTFERLRERDRVLILEGKAAQLAFRPTEMTFGYVSLAASQSKAATLTLLSAYSQGTLQVALAPEASQADRTLWQRMTDALAG